MPRKKREPCPAGVEDACPVPRYRCKEFGEPGRHCFELFAEFEAFVLPGVEAVEDDEPDMVDVKRIVMEQLRAHGITEDDAL